MTDIGKRVLKEKAQSKPGTKTANGCYENIAKLDAFDNLVASANELIKLNGDNIPKGKSGWGRYRTQSTLGQLMFDNAKIFADKRGGVLISYNQMLGMLKRQGATVKESDDKYVKYTDTITKELIILTKRAFQKRMTGIRKYVKENYPT